MIKAHGGSKDLLNSNGMMVNGGLFVTNTMAGKQNTVHEKNLGRLISNTIGEPSGRPVMDGVLSDTKQGTHSVNVPEVHKVSGKGKTQPKRMGQVPFAGAKY
jgi:hypothetical protein